MAAASSVGRGSALADALTVGNVLLAGLEKNGWRITAVRVDPTFHEKDHGAINGVVMFERETFPFPGKGWGTARWDLQPSGPAFFTGNYDLTREEAEADFAKRGLG